MPHTSSDDARPSVLRRAAEVLHLGEDLFSILLVLLMMLFPLWEALYRKIAGTSIVGMDSVVQHGTLLLTFTAAAMTARAGKHLRFDTGLTNGDFGIYTRLMRLLSNGVSVGLLFVLTYASWKLVQTGMDSSSVVGRHLPIWVAQLVMPLALIAIAFRLLYHSSDSWLWRGGTLLLASVFPLFSMLGEDARAATFLPGLVLLILAVIFGAPIFILMGGLAALAFFTISNPSSITALIDIPDAAYTIVTNPFLPAIPLFTIAGAVLAHGNTSRRLVDLFRAMFGFLPGGVAVATALLFAFFTTFSGASGVTILALGPLLMPLLMKNRYPENFSLGMLTSAGSLGMLFPPCLPVILIGVTLAQPVDKMFIGGLLPGFLLIGMIAAYSVFTAMRNKVERQRFDWAELKRTVWIAKWEIFLPILVLGGIFGGFVTLVESSALTALYAIIIEVFIHRDFNIRSGLRSALTQGIILVGGILIIIGLAKGLTQFLVDEMIAESVTDWVLATISNKYVFLLVLNILLLVVGCIMDIVSAIIVIVPLCLRCWPITESIPSTSASFSWSIWKSASLLHRWE